jgi:hypothetical protein
MGKRKYVFFILGTGKEEEIDNRTKYGKQI